MWVLFFVVCGLFAFDFAPFHSRNVQLFGGTINFCSKRRNWKNLAALIEDLRCCNGAHSLRNGQPSVQQERVQFSCACLIGKIHNCRNSPTSAHLSDIKNQFFDVWCPTNPDVVQRAPKANNKHQAQKSSLVCWKSEKKTEEASKNILFVSPVSQAKQKAKGKTKR